MLFYKIINSPLGPLCLVSRNDAIVALYVGDEEAPLKIKAKKNDKHPLLSLAASQLREYFKGLRTQFDLPIDPSGTEFQQKAWSALQKIPFGEIWSYGQQALFLKSPKAQRAVGGANGRNPIPIIIPCHRIVGANGKLTGFSGGMKMKIDLLEHEGHTIDVKKLKILL